MANPSTFASVALQLCGATHALRFDWAALAALRSTYGAEFQERISDGLVTLDFDVMASVIAAGVGGRLSPAEIMADPPAIVPAITAIQRALSVAYHGPEGLRDETGPFAVARRAAGDLLAMLSRILSRPSLKPAAGGMSFGG